MSVSLSSPARAMRAEPRFGMAQLHGVLKTPSGKSRPTRRDYHDVHTLLADEVTWAQQRLGPDAPPARGHIRVRPNPKQPGTMAYSIKTPPPPSSKRPGLTELDDSIIGNLLTGLPARILGAGKPLKIGKLKRGWRGWLGRHQWETRS